MDGNMASTSSSTASSVSCVSRSTVEALKCPPLQSSRTQDVFHSVVKGRKSWKTLRGGEVVWPPELEAALIEGLENYTPDDSRETRLLGRFPMRNRYISDYIFQKTGKRRTAKQVGSRLQQLRDTCGGKKLLSLLSPIRRQVRPSHTLSPSFTSSTIREDCDSSSDGSVPSTPTDAHASLHNLLYRGAGSPGSVRQPVVYIDLLPEDAADDGSQDLPQIDEDMCMSRGYYLVRSADRPRHLRAIDPTVTLSSSSVYSPTSHFVVYSPEGEVHSEAVPMEYCGVAPTDSSLHLYKATLAPGFWPTLIQSADPTQFTIVQRVQTSDGLFTFSAMYKFSYPTSFLSQDFHLPLTPFAGQLQLQDNVKIAQCSPPSQLDFLDSLFSMPVNEGMVDMEYGKSFYNTNCLRPNDQWDMSSPVSLSSGNGSDFDQISTCEEDMRSPLATSFPSNVHNYIPVLQ